MSPPSIECDFLLTISRAEVFKNELHVYTSSDVFSVLSSSLQLRDVVIVGPSYFSN